jgi:hypothetical protein
MNTNVAPKDVTVDGGNLIETVAGYFRSEHWARALEVLSISDEPIYHAHVYVETQIHPLSLEEIIKGYFGKSGKSVHRKIEIFTSGQVADSGSIHGIEPEGMPHFDVLWKYSPDALLAPARREHNVEYWGQKYMDQFYAKYPFKTEVNSEQEAELEAYFESAAFKKYCELNEHPDVVHIHANVETSVHPNLIRTAALKAMAKRGWDIEQAVPVAFQMRGQMHGKIVFLGSTPEKIFDIAWAFNPAATLIPSTKYWLTTENPTYDARTMHELPLLLKRDPYRLLSLREIEAIVAAI